MYGFIFGFHRLVWWPKWTPASSNLLIISVVNVVSPFLGFLDFGSFLGVFHPKPDANDLIYHKNARIQQILCKNQT